MNPVFKRLFKLVPDGYRDNSCIAGGAAVDLETADDIDIFVLGITDDSKMNHFRNQLTAMGIPGAHIRDINNAEDTAKEADKGPLHADTVKRKRHIETIAQQDVQQKRYGNKNSVCVDIPATIFFPAIQIIASPWRNPQELLRNFDLSIACVAFSPKGETITIDETTDIKTPPKVVHLTWPVHTFIRYRRYCQRFNLEPDPQELVKICIAADNQDA